MNVASVMHFKNLRYWEQKINNNNCMNALCIPGTKAAACEQKQEAGLA